ncbi:ROK family protein [Marvinbryantia formatexigens DSM 14469]|uniref:ROK family protein n=1 Tax=Marvinbryantia formatexigens DSM 14469 TaxID=478749 RepID=C6L9A4_9FIRM|nr:ROK family protein [Marvinbryantia formatexigens]EET62843.1 ROK family protein [Marvinbryantia formatexigens DSM 14469]UWO23188.1 ROK family protein [Marvinbryantia formatexigens DSM 14469]SDG02910.1 Sugar kinase of the NBD/HSP70 family, may contain an N-terminal HTH domain [Marvinbryantia formatexigens]
MKICVLDIGGTAIKAGICENGALSDLREFATEAKLGGMHVAERAQEIIESYRREHEFSRIGISTAGQVDPVQGSIIWANENIPGYTGMRLKDRMEEAFGIPVDVENDVNAAALGEAVFGAGKGLRDFVCLTYGTGVGGALFLDGKLYGGSSYSAGEFGAVVTHPEKRDLRQGFFSGCYEKYASATALVERAGALDASLTDGRAIFARKEEPAVAEVIDAWIEEIVYGLITIIHMLNPAGVILGGGVMEQPCVPEKIRERLYENIMPSFRGVQIKKAELGNRAGLLGASVLHEKR